MMSNANIIQVQIQRIGFSNWVWDDLLLVCRLRINVYV